MAETQSLVERLNDTGIFDAKMRPPPSECLPHVIQHELTTGCSWNKCTYCKPYKGKYNVKLPSEFEAHVDAVWEQAKNELSPDEISQMKRIYIGGSDALSVGSELLNHAVQYAIGKFKREVGRLPSRVAVYGGTNNMLDFTSRSMKYVECGGVCGNCSIGRHGDKIGLNMIYWGLESGSTRVLDYVKKGCSKDDIYTAADILTSGIRTSVMIMPGLGGMALADEHSEQTIRVLNHIEPKFLTLIGINACEKTPYARRMAQEVEDGTNRPLTQAELVEQTMEIIRGLRFETIVGCHPVSVHTFDGECGL